ncbi:MAG: polysaccharide deacetylase family protein [Chloroflexi bacterium]|nr:polysaccharide deacetylase family protein [Chloroflexota bacterium]
MGLGKVVERKGSDSTRREVLRQFLGAAAAVPLVGLPAAPFASELSDSGPDLGLNRGQQAVPTENPVAAPAAEPVYWQPPYRNEPAIPENSVVLPILMYHRATVSHVFEAQLVGMLAAGYRPLSLHSALKGLMGEAELPDMPIVLTFDDGWRIQYDVVFPVLKQYKVPATFFVMPGFHERQDGYMDWDQLTDIADFGMEVESHTLNHADLPRLAVKDWGAVLAEVVISKQLLEERVGGTPRYFDYPLGYQNEQIRQVVQAAGYEAAVIIGPGVHQSVDALYTLRRIRVEAWDPWWSVARKLNWYGAGTSSSP